MQPEDSRLYYSIKKNAARRLGQVGTAQFLNQISTSNQSNLNLIQPLYVMRMQQED